MKAIITSEHLEKLEIVDRLRLLKGILNTNIPQDVEALAARLSCDVGLLTEVLEALGIEIVEE